MTKLEKVVRMHTWYEICEKEMKAQTKMEHYSLFIPRFMIDFGAFRMLTADK